MTGLILQTRHLTLRPPVPADWPAYRAYRLSPRSTLAGGDEGTAWTHFAAFFGHWALRGFGRFVACLTDTGQPIGHFGPFRPEPWPEAELTWTLWDAAFEGKGLAYEAATAARDHVFRDLRWETAVSYIETANTRSQALARRLGAEPDPTAAAPYPGASVWRHPRAFAAETTPASSSRKRYPGVLRGAEPPGLRRVTT
jgi:RimJ/RimL family protein N-acetyltransferase